MIFPTPTPPQGGDLYFSRGHRYAMPPRAPLHVRVSGTAANPQKSIKPLPGEGLGWGTPPC